MTEQLTMSGHFSTTATIALGLMLLSVMASATYWLNKISAKKLHQHPLVYSLAIFTSFSTFSFFGASNLAHHFGYSYLIYYLGSSALFLFAPLLLAKLMDISIQHRLRSIADLMTFRFHNQAIGTITTIALTLCSLPLMLKLFEFIQLTTHSFSQPQPKGEFFVAGNINILIFGVCLAVIACLIDSQKLRSHSQKSSLLPLVALLGLVSLISLVAAGYAAYTKGFEAQGGFTNWLQQNPDASSHLKTMLPTDAGQFLIAIFASAVITLPHSFHLLFAEQPRLANLKIASWLVPSFLLLAAITIPPIYWASQTLNPGLSAKFTTFQIGQTLQLPWLEMLIYFGSLASASAIIIVASISLSGMWMNHIVLAAMSSRGLESIYRWLLTCRRSILCLLIAVPMLLQLVFSSHTSFLTLGAVTMTGLLQLIPGVFAVLFWNHCTRWGVFAGLFVGASYWLTSVALPLLGLGSFTIFGGFVIEKQPTWIYSASASFLLNSFALIGVSLLSKLKRFTRASSTESSPSKTSLSFHTGELLTTRPVASTSDMLKRLMPELGQNGATQEIRRALEMLDLSENEIQPATLRRIRNQLEINLSGYLGPEAARRIMNNAFGERPRVEKNTPVSATKSVEQRLQLQKMRMSSLSAELHKLKIHHRQTLQDLPVGMCSIANSGEILIWNREMQAITSISSSSIIGSSLTSINTPWTHLLGSFLQCSDERWIKQQVIFDEEHRWVNLIKTANNTASTGEHSIIIEDVTESQQMEDQLSHQERLASIGRLAAGVAHEIGNPVTGIACLAQDMKFALEDDLQKDMATQILGQTKRITSIVQSLVNFSHSSENTKEAQAEPVLLHRITSEAIKLVTLDRNAKPVYFENICREGLVIKGNAQKMLQILINLLNNARDASLEHDSVIIMGKAVDDLCELSITDLGKGIPKELHSKVFEPFFTTKPVGKGTGLGLSLVYSAIQEMGGTISIESPVPEFGRGTRILLTFNTYSIVQIFDKDRDSTPPAIHDYPSQ